jgi:hypothetical protein
MYCGPDIGPVVVGCQHHLFYGPPEFIGGTIITAGQLAYCSVHIGFSPQQRSPVIKESEVVRVVPFLLNNLELNVLIIQSFVIGLGILFRKRESGAGEEVCNLLGPEPVSVIELSIGLLVFLEILLVKFWFLNCYEYILIKQFKSIGPPET